MSVHAENRRFTIRDLHAKKRAGERIVCLTAYDASFAGVLDDNGIDVVLVGDSLGMVVQGLETTLPVTMEDMLYHCRSVARGLGRALLMVDMPYLSYTTVEAALENAGRFMKQAGAQMVKLEGGSEQSEVVEALSQQGIPVCAHLGLQPQRVHKLGGYRVQGRDEADAVHMIDAARQLEQSGADMMLLECVPETLAARITGALSIPVIGIGAGASCDGQILVLYDILGISRGHIPKFSCNFMDGAGSVQAAVRAYADAVRSGNFPDGQHVFR